MKKVCKTKILLFLVMIMLIPIYASAATISEVDWKDEDKREEAWMVYIGTNWPQVGDLTFAANGSYSEASIPSDIDEAYRSIVQSALGKAVKKGMYEPTDYENLILCIMQAMASYDPGLLSGKTGFPDIDICNINTFIDPTRAIQSQEESVLYLYDKICECETAYNSAHPDQPCDIFQDNQKLQGMVQSIIYPGYNQEYTNKSVKQYYKDNLKDNDNIQKYNDFAKVVSSYYKAVKASNNSHIIDG